MLSLIALKACYATHYPEVISEDDILLDQGFSDMQPYCPWVYLHHAMVLSTRCLIVVIASDVKLEDELLNGYSIEDGDEVRHQSI